jgi:hypothetical protein
MKWKWNAQEFNIIYIGSFSGSSADYRIVYILDIWSAQQLPTMS